MRKLIVAASVIALAMAGQAMASEGSLRAGDRIGDEESDSLSQAMTALLIIGGLTATAVIIGVSDDEDDDGVSG